MFPRVLLFLSTPSARRATRRCCSRRHCGQYFYPRPLRGGRPGERGNFQDAGDFYPRPLRGGRRGGLAAFNLQAAISIHALCEEGDPSGYRRCKPLSKFLSTPSARRATAAASAWQTAAAYFYPRPLRGGRRGCAHGLPLCKNFYPRPLRGGRRGKFEQSNLDTDISIHALCEEGDCCCICMANSCCIFLSTPSARRATCGGRPDWNNTGISIHALREEGDRASF